MTSSKIFLIHQVMVLSDKHIKYTRVDCPHLSMDHLRVPITNQKLIERLDIQSKLKLFHYKKKNRKSSKVIRNSLRQNMSPYALIFGICRVCKICSSLGSCCFLCPSFEGVLCLRGGKTTSPIFFKGFLLNFLRS